jgi:hypothetical protein
MKSGSNLRFWFWGVWVAGLFWLAIGVLPTAAIAMPHPTPTAKLLLANAAPSQFPPDLANKLRTDLSRKVNVPASQLRVVETTAKTWPDGCLGLAQSDEMCTQMMVNGWRVVLTNGKQRWVYRTDQRGRVYRLEPTGR